MKKSIIAIFLIFTLIFSFAACRKADGKTKGETEVETKIQSKVYAVDEEGLTHKVEASVNAEGKTEYFYIGEDGKEVTVAPAKVVVQTKAVEVVKPAVATDKKGNLTPEAQSIYEMFNDPSAINKMVDNTVPDKTLKHGNKTIPQNKIKKVEATTDAEGNPVHPTESGGSGGGVAALDYKKIIESGKYSASISICATVDGETVTVPITIAKDGDMLYMSTFMPVQDLGSTQSDFLIRDGQCYMIIPALRGYMVSSVEEVEDIFSPDTLEADKNGGKFVQSGQYTASDGVTYDCDEYLNDDGTTVRYFYQYGNVKRIETLLDGESNIMEINYVSPAVDSSLFNVPSGYFDLATMMGMDTTVPATTKE